MTVCITNKNTDQRFSIVALDLAVGIEFFMVSTGVDKDLHAVTEVYDFDTYQIDSITDYQFLTEEIKRKKEINHEG